MDGFTEEEEKIIRRMEYKFFFSQGYQEAKGWDELTEEQGKEIESVTNNYFNNTKPQQ